MKEIRRKGKKEKKKLIVSSKHLLKLPLSPQVFTKMWVLTNSCFVLTTKIILQCGKIISGLKISILVCECSFFINSFDLLFLLDACDFFNFIF